MPIRTVVAGALLLLVGLSLGAGGVVRAQDLPRLNPNAITDLPGGDFYSFEVSDLEVYNAELDLSGATAAIAPGPSLSRERTGASTNDVLTITGTGAQGFGLFRPRRVSTSDHVSVQASLGVLTDGGVPDVDGIVEGQTFGAVEIDIDGSDPLNFAFCGAAPGAGGITTFGRNQNGAFPNTFQYPGVFAVDCLVERGRAPNADGVLSDFTLIASRPSGTDAPFDIIVIDFAPLSTVTTALSTLDGTEAWSGDAGITLLELGGAMFIDDLVTQGLNGDIEQPVIDLISRASFLEGLARRLVEEGQPDLATSRLDDSVALLGPAAVLLATGGFLPSTRLTQALAEVNTAMTADREARTDLENGDESGFSVALFDGQVAKIDALVHLRGHNPRSGPFPDGMGGFDLRDQKIWRNSFEDPLREDVDGWAFPTQDAVNWALGRAPGGDFYGFEVSALDVYNLQFGPGDIMPTIGPAPDLMLDDILSTNDALNFTSTGQGSDGLVRLPRIAAGEGAIQVTLGFDGVLRPTSPESAPSLFVQLQQVGSGSAQSTVCGARLSATGILAFAQDENGEAPNTRFYPDADALDCSVYEAVAPDNAGVTGHYTIVKSRPAGADKLVQWDVLLAAHEPLDASLPIPGWQTGFGVDNLDEGGRVYVDDVLTFGFNGTAEQPVIDLIEQALDLELDAMDEASVSPDAAVVSIDAAIGKLTEAETLLNAGGFAAETNSAAALSAVRAALDDDRAARDFLTEADAVEAVNRLLDSALEKALAQIMLRGHNPQPGPFPDGMGGVDFGDPIFTDGFESGDVSAWSR